MIWILYRQTLRHSAVKQKNLLEQLQSRNERMFLVTVLVMNTADNKQKLDNMFFAAQGIAQKYNSCIKASLTSSRNRR